MTGLALASVSDERTSGYATHDVLNQPGALAGYNAYAADKPLTAALRTFGADWADERLQRTGALVGSEQGPAPRAPGQPASAGAAHA